MSHGIGVDENIPAADWAVGVGITGVRVTGHLFNGDIEEDRRAVVICTVGV